MSGRGGPLVLALDAGTTTTKAALVSPDGRLAGLARVACPPRDLGGGQVEADAAALLRALDRAAAEALRAAGPAARSRLAGIALATQRSTAVLWRAADGRPVAPAISWMDSRTAPETARLAPRAAEVEARTGLKLSPHYVAPKLAWWFRREPAWARAARHGEVLAGTLSSFLLRHLLGGRHVQDHTNGQRTSLLSIRTYDWDPALLRLFGIPRRCLGEPVPAVGRLGGVTRWGVTLPLLAVLGDQQAAALAALDPGRPGDALVNYGTGAFVLVPSGPRARRVPGLLTSLLTTRRGPDGAVTASYALEGSIQSAGSLVSWALRTMDALGVPSPKSLSGERPALAALARAARAARGTVACVPSPAGLAAPWWIPDLPPALAGLGADTPPAEVVRAVRDAIAGCACEILARAGRPARLLVSGPLSRWDDLLRVQAAAGGLAVVRLAQAEATLVGAARSAFSVLGVPTRADPPARTFRPAAGAAARRRFRVWSATLAAAIRSHRIHSAGGRRVWPRLARRPALVAHRGFRARFPENTLAAFRGAFSLGAAMIELDVRLTRDGVPVVFHDRTLGRTAGGRGPAEDASFRALRRLDAGGWFAPRFRGERVPTLGEALDLLPPRGLAYVEVKAPGAEVHAADSRALRRACDAATVEIKRRRLEERALVASFDPRVFLYVKLGHPELRTGLIFEKPAAFAEARRLGLRALDVLCPRADLVTPAAMAEWRRLGLLVFAWTAKTERDWRRLAGLGVDAIVADDAAVRPRPRAS